MAEYPYFPMFVDLSGKQVLIVGAGKIGARRIEALTAFTPSILVVAPAAQPQIAQLEEEKKLSWRRRTFREEDLETIDLAVIATNDAELNAQIGRLCRERGIPVNVASDRTLCDFYFPGIVQTEEAVIGVTCSGKDHALAKKLTGKIRRMLGEAETEDHSGKE